MKNLTQRLLELESLTKEQQKEIDQLIKENRDLNLELIKAKDWARLRNDQVGQLINTLENHSNKYSNDNLLID